MLKSLLLISGTYTPLYSCTLKFNSVKWPHCSIQRGSWLWHADTPTHRTMPMHQWCAEASTLWYATREHASNVPTHQCASDVPMCRSAESRRVTPARQHTLTAPVPMRQYTHACLHTYSNPICWAIEPCIPGTRLSYKTLLYHLAPDYLAPAYTLFGPMLMQINQS